MSATDRELLELAAKAAGIAIYWKHCAADIADFDLNDRYGPFIERTGILFDNRWNPLVDDGDALRLSVRLQLTVCNEHVSSGAAYCMSYDGGTTYYDVRSGTNEGAVIKDDYAATRRAIVLAAACIGRSLP